MNVTSVPDLDDVSIGTQGRPYPVFQVSEEEKEEEIQTAAPDTPVEADPEPDTADPALEDSYTLLTTA